MNKLVWTLAVLCLVGAGCNTSEPTRTTTQNEMDDSSPSTTVTVVEQEIYTSESWKDSISESCMSFSDGCNTCNRGAEGGVVACTKKACAVYEQPVCLDATPADTQTTSTERRVEVLKSNKQGDPDANRYDFGDDGFTDPDDDGDGLEDAQEPTVTVKESSATDYNSSRSNR